MATISADGIFKFIFLNGDVYMSIKMSLKSVPKGPVNTYIALVQIMACRQVGDKPLSQPTMVKFTDPCMRHSASIS